MDECLICERVALARAGENPWLIEEMEHTFFVVGDHQFHRGYALVLLKEHIRWEEATLFALTKETLTEREMDALGADIAERLPDVVAAGDLPLRPGEA